MSGRRPGRPDPDLALDDLTSAQAGPAERAEHARTWRDYTRQVLRLRLVLFGLAAVVAVPAVLVIGSDSTGGSGGAAAPPEGYDADGVRLTGVAADAAPAAPSPLQQAPAAPSEEAAETGARTAPARTEPVVPEAPAERISAEWLARVSGQTGIPERALLGYAGAQLVMEHENPACGVSWVTLAAIGSVETEHGTWGGGRIGADGTTTKPIIGIALDGGNGTAAVPDTDGGRLDGDTEWDRAVGPLQFIPATWRTWAADGDGDGVEDPHDIDDAALAAARYLCADGRDLTDGDQWWRAVHAYNHSDAYVGDVYERADHYATRTQ